MGLRVSRLWNQAIDCEERRRKEHERKGWEVMAFQVDVKKTEDRFKSFLKSQGIEAVGGHGLDEVYQLNDAFLQCARNFQWPLGIYTRPMPYRRSTNISRPGPTSLDRLKADQAS